MLWTKEESELISVLDSFLESCSQSEKLKDSSPHRLLEQILAVTKGEVTATKQYCQQVLNNGGPIAQQQLNPENSLVERRDSVASSIDSFNIARETLPRPLVSKTAKFQSFWTLLFLILATVTIFFAAKKLPKTSNVETVSNLATLCPASLLETARIGITNRNELLLEKAIADFQVLEETQGERLGIECQQMLWETQFVYAIDFLASSGQQKQAVENLCNISPQYYQNRETIPWFTRWSNINSEFSQWLTQYKLENDCAVASYLE